MANIKARAQAFAPRLKSIAKTVAWTGGLASIAGLYAYGVKTQVDWMINQAVLTWQQQYPNLFATVDGLYNTLNHRGRVKEANDLKRLFALAPTPAALQALITKYEQQYQAYFRAIQRARAMGRDMELNFRAVMDIANYLVQQKRYAESTELTVLFAYRPDSEELAESIVMYNNEMKKTAAPKKQQLKPKEYPAELRGCVDEYNAYVAKLNRPWPLRPNPKAIKASQKRARIACHPDKHRAHQQQANAISAMLTD